MISTGLITGSVNLDHLVKVCLCLSTVKITFSLFHILLFRSKSPSSAHTFKGGRIQALPPRGKSIKNFVAIS